MVQEASKLILPAGPRLKTAYMATLKSMYIDHKDVFFLGELVNIIALGCGVSVDTATNYCKELDKFKLIHYQGSSIMGHKYAVRVYVRDGGRIVHVDTWSEFDQIIMDQLDHIVESDLAELCRSVNTLEESGLRDTAVKEFDRLRQGSNILPGGDSIKSEFKTLDKMTKEEAVSQFEEDLVKNKKKSDSIIVKEAEFLGGI